MTTEPQADPQAPDDIDALISEFEATEPAPPAEPEAPAETTGDPQADELVDRINGTLEWAAERQQQEYEAKIQSDFDAAVKAVADGVEGVGERLVRGILYSELSENAAFHHAFGAREGYPDMLRDHLGRIARELKEELSNRPDPQLTEDRSTIADAVMASSRVSGSPEPDEISHKAARKMSDEQLEEYLTKHS